MTPSSTGPAEQGGGYRGEEHEGRGVGSGGGVGTDAGLAPEVGGERLGAGRMQQQRRRQLLHAGQEHEGGPREDPRGRERQRDRAQHLAGSSAERTGDLLERGRRLRGGGAD